MKRTVCVDGTQVANTDQVIVVEEEYVRSILTCKPIYLIIIIRDPSRYSGIQRIVVYNVYQLIVRSV